MWSAALSVGLCSLPEERQERLLSVFFVQDLAKVILSNLKHFFLAERLLTGSPEMSEYFLAGFRDGGASML